MNIRRVLVIGGTGMLGRPVVRRLIEDGFLVRCFVRNVDRARAMLPTSCEFAKGDVRDDQRLVEALDDCDAAYINLSEPMTKRKPAWDVEVEGTRAVIAACRASGVLRVLRISAMGVDDAAAEPNGWWAAKSKADADRWLMESDREWTVFRPTWFMESLCTFKIAGGVMVCPDLPRSPLRWITGDDFARQVSAALQASSSARRVYQPQGPELLTIGQALRRFRCAWKSSRLHVLPTPVWMMRPSTKFSGKAHYLVSLMNMTRDHFARLDREIIPTDLPAARMTIEDYAEYVAKTHDWPSK